MTHWSELIYNRTPGFDENISTDLWREQQREEQADQADDEYRQRYGG